MQYSIPYERGSITIALPDSCRVRVLEPNEFAAGPLAAIRGSDPAAVSGSVAYATAHPLGSAPLAEFLKGGRDILVIVNDATRPTPTNLVLDAIADLLEAVRAPGAASADATSLQAPAASPQAPPQPRVRFIVATGAHRAPTEDEYRQILGQHYARFRACTTAHNARDAVSLVDLGSTRNGTPILLNKAVFEADRIVAIGSVEPHYFAGYTGGRKAFLPGIAAYATIEANHKLALSPLACALGLEQNPVSQDMDDALKLIKTPTFSIMTVLDKEQRLAWCSAGDIRASFREAVDKANAIFSVPIDGLFDIVVSAARYPMDIDLYQSQKAIDNGALALADGGTLILVSSCRDGIGDRAFLELMGSAATPGEVLEKIRSGYRLGYHKAAKIALIAQRASIWAHTGLDPDLVKKAFIRPCPNLQEALDEAIARYGAANKGSANSGSAKSGPAPRICIIPDGTVTVPLLRRG